MTKTKIGVGNFAEPYVGVASRITTSNKYWLWGDDNQAPTHLAQLSRRSTIHRRIINDKADYISGKGVVVDGASPKSACFVERVNGDGESLRQLMSKLAFDKALFGNAFLEVVTDSRHSFLSLYHRDASTCRVAKESDHILLHSDWANFHIKDAKSLSLYPKFEKQEDGTLRSIIHYKDYEPTFEHYGVPPYVAGMNVADIAYRTDRWNIARLENSFQMSGVMLLDDAVESEAEADRVVRTAQEKFGGKPGQVLFVVKDGSENDNSRFIPITSSNDGDWAQLHDQSIADVVVAHSWFIALSGLNYSSSFSADRILHEYEVALNTVILVEQAELMEPIKSVMAEVLGEVTDSLMIVNRPPTRSKPVYMKVWEARKADGLDYDPEEEGQQRYITELTNGGKSEIGGV